MVIKNIAKANRKKYAKILINDNKHNLSAAVDELKYWKSVKKSKTPLKKVFANYNNGTVINKTGIAYANDVTARIKYLRKYSRKPKETIMNILDFVKMMGFKPMKKLKLLKLCLQELIKDKLTAEKSVVSLFW